MRARILIVDDDETIRKSLGEALDDSSRSHSQSFRSPGPIRLSRRKRSGPPSVTTSSVAYSRILRKRKFQGLRPVFRQSVTRKWVDTGSAWARRIGRAC